MTSTTTDHGSLPRNWNTFDLSENNIKFFSLFTKELFWFLLLIWCFLFYIAVFLLWILCKRKWEFQADSAARIEQLMVLANIIHLNRWVQGMPAFLCRYLHGNCMRKHFKKFFIEPDAILNRLKLWLMGLLLLLNEQQVHIHSGLYVEYYMLLLLLGLSVEARAWLGNWHDLCSLLCESAHYRPRAVKLHREITEQL